MDVNIRIFLILFLVFLSMGSGFLIHGQSVEVSEPRIQLIENVFHIRYDILNCSPSDKFNIRLEITDEKGMHIAASALEGDIGKGIPGGADKLITWDLEKDEIFLNTQIYFQVHATFIYTPPAKEDSPDEGKKAFTRSSLTLQSLAFPGLGLSRITDKPHWIRGAAGYACVAGSLVFNLQARNTYRSIEDYPGFDNKMEAFDRSVMEDNISDVLAFVAIGVWITDFFWTRAGTKHLSRKNLQGLAGGMRIDPGLDPLSMTPTLVFTYRF